MVRGPRRAWRGTATAILGAALLLSGGARAATLRIGTDGAYPPYNATTSSGKLVGFEIDLINDLCRRMAATCAFVATDWSAMIPNLRQGRVDVVMSALSILPERQKIIDFSTPYFTAPTACVTYADSKLAGIGNMGRVDLNKLAEADRSKLREFARRLNKSVIGVEGSTTHEELVKKYIPGIGRVRIYPSQENLYLDTVIGRVDAACVGLVGLNLFVNQERAKGRKFVIIGPRITGGLLGPGVAFGLRKGDRALTAKLNRALAEARSDGSLSRLSVKWFGFDGTPGVTESAPRPAQGP